MDNREHVLDCAVKTSVDLVYATIFDSGMSPAECRLAWLRVIGKLVQSAEIQAQATVVAEWMGLRREGK